jgi:hypothetical protein
MRERSLKEISLKRKISTIAVGAARVSGKTGKARKKTAATAPIVQLVTDLVVAARRDNRNENGENQVHSGTKLPGAQGTKKPTTVGLRRTSLMLILVLGLCAGVAAAQTAETSKTPYGYGNDVFVGGSYMRAAAGPSLGSTNLGGWNVAVTHYFTPLLGFTADFDGDYGHASLSNSQFVANPFVYQHLFLAGPQIRWIRKERFSSSIRLLAGAVDAASNSDVEGISPTSLGLYPNTTKLAFKPGGAFDFNLSPRVALRFSSGALLERQNGDFQRIFNVSTGIVFRIGK